MMDVAGKYSRSKAAKPADGWAVFNKERFKRYALLICQGMDWRLKDLIAWLEEDEDGQREEETKRSSGTNSKQKTKRQPRRQSAK